MKIIFYLSLTLLFLSNRCAPEITVIEIRNNLPYKTIILSKKDFKDYTEGFLTPNVLSERTIGTSESKLIYLEKNDLDSFKRGKNYVFYIMKYSHNNNLYYFKKIIIPTEKLIINSKENYFTFKTEKEIKIILEKA